MCSLATFDVMEVVAILGEVFGIGGVKCETVAASLQLGGAVVTLPIFIT